MVESLLGQLGVLSGLGLTSVVLGLTGALLAGIGWYQARGARAAKNWGTAQGEVLEATVEQYLHSTDDGTMTAYRPRIIYGYRVGGRDYVGERLNFGGAVHSSLRGLAENKARQFPTGSKVQVYYDPQNPNEATLERTAPASRLLYIIGGVMLVIAVVVCAAGAWWWSYLEGV